MACLFWQIASTEIPVKLAEKLGNAEGGQTVCHKHRHLLDGRQMNWPPG